MAFRVVLIENEVDVKLKLDNLVLNTSEGEIWIPINDISIVVLDNLRITLSTRLLCTLAKCILQPQSVTKCNAKV